MPKRAYRHSPDPGETAQPPATLFETLDLLPQHQALLTPRGDVVRLNRWLVELLRRMPGGRHLEAALRTVARSIAESGPGAGDGAHGEAPPPMTRFPTATGVCLLWGWCVELDRYGLGRLVLMTVQPLDRVTVPDHVLRKELGLTRKEVDVVRLLAEGRSNAAIAAALFISPHTARHHTERIMAKLGVRSRAEVGPRLRSSLAEPGR
ncbi:MAG TPA: helix-turn-helix transcriptional regulator [Longimicrobiaceae bacterium]|nr:helix-turn-helix transcriptional regulator [Longimicrobiaceae bacterium]